MRISCSKVFSTMSLNSSIYLTRKRQISFFKMLLFTFWICTSHIARLLQQVREVFKLQQSRALKTMLREDNFSRTMKNCSRQQLFLERKYFLMHNVLQIWTSSSFFLSGFTFFVKEHDCQDKMLWKVQIEKRNEVKEFINSSSIVRFWAVIILSLDYQRENFSIFLRIDFDDIYFDCWFNRND